MSLFELIFGKYGGMRKKDLKKMTMRHRFSEYLPYVAYDPETRVYLNSDNTVGFMWECSPLSFAGMKTVTVLEGLFRIGFPDHTIMQFTLYADDYIEPFVNSHRATVQRDSAVAGQAVDSYAGFLIAGKKGVESMGGAPIRNYRLFVSVKMPVAGLQGISLNDIEHNIHEILEGAFLYPEPLSASGLIDTLRRFINDEASLNNHLYNENVPIRNQIVFADTLINSSMDHLKIGSRHFKCLTPKQFPLEVNPMQTNMIFGGIDGIISDAEQYKTPYLYTLNIIFHELKSRIHAKCNLVLQQQAAGSFAPSLMRKKDEYLWATDAIEKGTKFVRVMPVLWVWSRDEKEAIEASMRAKRVWEAQGYVMQQDKGILTPLFISSLPFGLYDEKGNIESLERDFITPVDSVASILPVQADFYGGGKPILAFIGRKGQVCGIDIFDERANNHNIFITATSGSGKSFLVNYLVSKYYAANAMLRIIDIGGSYKKMNKLYGAKYIDFSSESQICLNPFTNIKTGEEFNYEVSAIAAIIVQMAYSSTDKIPPDTAETAMSLIKAAVRWAYREKANEANIDTVHEYLNTFPKNATDYDFDCEDNKDCTAEFKILAQTLAFNLSEFTTGHTYGKWFNGRSNIDITNDEFVVLELEHLKPQKELFKVVTLQVINEITRDLYLSDRSRPRFVIFDEAWQFIKDTSGGMSASTPLSEIIEEGYRRARKYHGSFSIITQSLLDMQSFGKVGAVIRGNTDFKFYLESVDFEKALDEKLIDYDEFTMRALKSLKSNKPKYSEIFMDTPFGAGVARLVVDPYGYYVYTSDARENTEIEGYIDRGMTYEQAIEEMIKEHRPEYYKKTRGEQTENVANAAIKNKDAA